MYGNILFGLYTPKLTEWERLINDFSNIQQPQCLLVCNVNDIYSPDLKDEEDWYGNITTVSPDYRYKNTAVHPPEPPFDSGTAACTPALRPRAA